MPLQPEIKDFIVAEGKELTVVNFGIDSIPAVFGTGNADGIANPGDSIVLLVQYDNKLWRTFLYTSDKLINPFGINERKPDIWSKQDHTGASAKYSIPMISSNCRENHTIEFFAEYWLPDNPPDHIIKRGIIKLNVSGKDNTPPLRWVKISGDNTIQVSDIKLLENAISSEYFSRIHASSKIAFKANDVHAAGIPYFSAHPVESQAEWDAVKNYNIDGVSTDRPDITLYLLENEIPTCSIINPVHDSVFNKDAAITIKADVCDTDSSITRIEFYCNGSLIGEDISRPYSCFCTDVAEGRHLLTAKVFDNGMIKISVPVIIHVK